MKSLGTDFLAALIDSGKGGDKWIKLGVAQSLFKGEIEVNCYEFAFAYLKKYGELPSRKIFDEAGLPALPDKVDGPAEFHWDKMKERHTKVVLKESLYAAADKINQGDVTGSYELMKSAIWDLFRVENGNRLFDYAKDGGNVVLKEYLNKAQMGDDYGLLLGWPTLDKMSGGLAGGDVVSFIGRPALGKTFKMLYSALFNWKAGKTPLFISMEMKPTPIMQRLAAMDTKLPIGQIKKAELSSKSLTKLKTQLIANKEGPPFWLVDGALSATVDDILLLCHQLKPDVVFIDGAYLLRHPNMRLGKWEKVTEIAERLKGELAEGLDIPLVQSYQFNRMSEKVKKGETPGLEHIAYTDAIGQLSSLVLGLLEEESVETKIARKITIMKGRSGEVGEFVINWRFDLPNAMDFTEKSTLIEEMQFL